MRLSTSRRAPCLGFAVAVAGLVAVVAVVAVDAGIAPSPFRPASLVTANLVMHNGRPFVALSELARALGGAGRYDPVRSRYEIQPGPTGVLRVNPGALAAVAHRPGPGGHAPIGQTSVKLGIGGQDVMIDDEEHLLLPPADPAISLEFLAWLLGGQARFDAGKGMWVLPPGDPGSPLVFR